MSQKLADQLNNSIKVENENSKYTKRSTIAKVGDYARAATQGLTFGTADEIEAGITSLFSKNKSYNQIIKGIRADINNFRERNCWCDCTYYSFAIYTWLWSSSFSSKYC